MSLDSTLRTRPLSSRLAGLGTTIFTEMSALAQKHGAVNLGQGFPDFPGPDWVQQAAQVAIDQGINQYAITHGSVNLRRELARHASRRLGREIDPETDVVVTSGATEAIMAGVLGLVDPGDNEHTSIGSLPGTWERTLTVSSGGKTFSLTGWKVGWSIAPPALNRAVRATHQFIVFCTAAPLQEGIAAGLAEAEAGGYYRDLQAAYQARRDFLISALREADLHPYVPQGTYFILCDISHLDFEDDVAFCRYLTTDIGVTAIPPSFFYAEEDKHLGRQMARFSFCKRQETLARAAQRLSALRHRG